MSSARYANPSIPAQQAAYRAPVPASNAPPGTFAPGTKVQCGSHRVVIEKYLSEGGFAHVYVCRIPKNDKEPHVPEVAVLKRVAVPDKEQLANMRTEVETMKKLIGHRHIVTYIDSHASGLKNGGYEVFLLMEYCQGGGLIDFMNTRLQHRLTEPEILHIFSDVAEGVATMHYLRPPLLHRDLKVENVLISAGKDGSKVYKVCDFGSTAPPRPAAKTAAEGRLIEDDVQRHTTLQYRSPEMIDVYRKQPIDEKSDIWALGVLLYKLCYYTTPFEEVGQMAILNATFKYPSYPVFSDRIKKLIGWMLRENPRDRPNIYQVIVEVCAMRHRTVPIKDIYSNRTQSEDRRNQQLPSADDVTSPPVIGLQKVAPVKQVQQIPDIAPMRRGRPTAPSQQPPAAKPSPSPLRGTTSDPFAALDSNNLAVRSAAADELAARFPSLDEFSLLHDRGQKFEFGSQPISSPDPKQDALKKRVAEALADEAFAFPPVTKVDSAPATKSSSAVTSTGVSRSVSVKKPARPEPSKDGSRPIVTPAIHHPTPTRPTMVSTGIQTSPAPSPAPVQKLPDVNKRPIWRVPDASHHHHHHQRALSTPKSFVEQPQPSPSSLRPDHALPPRPQLLDHRTKSHSSTLTIPQSPASSRPSLESQRPSPMDLGYSLDRSKSANSRPRPTSVHVESNLDFLRDREQAPGRNFDAPSLAKAHSPSAIAVQDPDEEDKNVRSSIDFLRAIEDDDRHKKHSHHRRSSSQSKHSKKGSLSSLGGLGGLASGTKSIVKGRFGDAFRKFESNNADKNENLEPPLTPTDRLIDRTGKALTPIAGSEATGGTSDDERVIDETEDLSPEVRRELERRRLSQEEKRVADAAAEYKKRLAEQGKGTAGPTRASTIQNRVRSLLDDSQKTVTPSRTAEGYGHYTDTGKPLPTRPSEQSGLPRSQHPSVARKPIPAKPLPIPAQTLSSSSELNYAKQRLPPHANTNSNPHVPISVSAPPAAQRTATGSSIRPSAPPKPKALRTGGPNDFAGSGNPSPIRKDRPTGTVMVPRGDDDADFDVESFSKRYPSLSGLEMQETEIPVRGRGVRDL